MISSVNVGLNNGYSSHINPIDMGGVAEASVSVSSALPYLPLPLPGTQLQIHRFLFFILWHCWFTSHFTFSSSLFVLFLHWYVIRTHARCYFHRLSTSCTSISNIVDGCFLLLVFLSLFYSCMLHYENCVSLMNQTMSQRYRITNHLCIEQEWMRCQWSVRYQITLPLYRATLPCCEMVKLCHLQSPLV